MTAYQPTSPQTQGRTPIYHPSIYKQLKKDSEIRLLTLRHGALGTPVECILQETLIEHAESYTALSYVWGDTSQQGEIILNGTQFFVTQSVKTALEHLRDETRDTILWIDAICIDQSSITERSQQVPLMRDIYSTASQVTIWLGPGDVATDLALHAMRRIASYSPDIEWSLDHFDTIVELCLVPSVCGSSASTDMATNLRKGLEDIFSRPWFDRTWTVQELAIARDCPILVCGLARICWDCFIEANHRLEQYMAKCNVADEQSDYWIMPNVRATSYSQKHTKLDRIREMVKADAELRSQHVDSNGVLFADLIVATRHTKCTDPRDKIYALLGLERCAAAKITVDYSLSVQMVFQKATMYIIMRCGFAILASQGWWKQRDDWPSWVIDFGNPEAQGLMSPLIKMTSRYDLRYCTLPISNNQLVASFKPDNVFRVHGLLLDRVAETAPILKAAERIGNDGCYEILLSTEAFQVFANAAQPCPACSAEKAHCAHHQYAPKNGSGPSAFRYALLRTLVADWVDPTRSYRQMTGTTSEQDLDDLEGVVHNLAEDNRRLISMNLLNEERPDINHVTNSFKIAVAEKIYKGLNAQVAFRTELGWIGTGSLSTEVGDCIVAVCGADVPYVLRHVGGPTQGRFRLIGACYVDGIMSGELTKNLLACKDGVIQLAAFDIC